MAFLLFFLYPFIFHASQLAKNNSGTETEKVIEIQNKTRAKKKQKKNRMTYTSSMYEWDIMIKIKMHSKQNSEI